MKIEDYVALEKILAELLCEGPVHFWGGLDTGVWVQSQGAMELYHQWTRCNDAAMSLAIEFNVWAQPYPVTGNETTVEGKFFFDDKFVSVFVPLADHENKQWAYRYAIVQAVILKIKKIKKIT